MKCRYHPKAELETIETTIKDQVPWSDEPVITYRDTYVCPKCWEEHEKGQPIKHDLITSLSDLEYWESQIDYCIESQIDERK